MLPWTVNPLNSRIRINIRTGEISWMMSIGPPAEKRRLLLEGFVSKLKAEVDKDHSIWIVERLTTKSGIIVKGKYACCYSDQPVGLVIVVCKADELTKDLTNPDLLVVDYENVSNHWIDTVMDKRYSNDDLVKDALSRLTKT